MNTKTTQSESSNFFTEIIDFKLKDGADEEKFLEANDQFHQQVFANTEGFLGRYVVKSEDENWTVIVRFEKSDFCKQAGEKIMKDMDSYEIFDYIDKNSMKIRYFTEKREYS